MRLVLVLWEDAQDHEETWVPIADAEAWGQVSCPVRSVGYVISDTSKYLSLAGDWDVADKNYGRPTKIPKGTIIKVIDLGDSQE